MGTRRLSGTIKDAFYRIERKRLVKTRNTWTSPLLSYSYPLPFLDYKLSQRVEKRFVLMGLRRRTVKALVIRIGFPEDHVLKAITGDVKEFGPLIECLSSSFPDLYHLPNVIRC